MFDTAPDRSFGSENIFILLHRRKDKTSSERQEFIDIADTKDTLGRPRRIRKVIN